MRTRAIPLEAMEMPPATGSRPLKRKLLVLGESGASVSDVVALLHEPTANAIHYVGDAASSTNEELLGLVQHYNVTDVAVASSSQILQAMPERMYDCLLSLKLMGIRIHDLSAFCERALGKMILHDHAARELVFGNHYHFDRRWQAVKRTVDIAVAAGLLILTLPLLLGVALAVGATSRGPVFYRQERVGMRGRTFSIIKFRSMRVDAEQDGIARFAARDDDRVTPVGEFIRKTRIDELPQLLNVLVGDMSIVGPRPERPVFAANFKKTVPLYDLRHSVKPGVTGWAQVRECYAASETETRNKVSRDLYYIKNGSLWLDVSIMVRTAWVMLTCQGSR